MGVLLPICIMWYDGGVQCWLRSIYWIIWLIKWDAEFFLIFGCSSKVNGCTGSLPRSLYQAMAEVIEERFANWQGQDFDEDTLEPSEVAQAIMEYLDCECTYFPSMADDDPIMSAYSYAQRLGVREGFCSRAYPGG